MLAFSNDYYGFIFRATQSVELFCAYFINVAMNNIYHLTTEQVENKPIKDENGVMIGRLTDADEDLIYGIVFNVSSIYKDTTPASYSIEIVSKKEGE